MIHSNKFISQFSDFKSNLYKFYNFAVALNLNQKIENNRMLLGRIRSSPLAHSKPRVTEVHIGNTVWPMTSRPASHGGP
jgi:hypothetical protein